jgi:hypothetical protein
MNIANRKRGNLISKIVMFSFVFLMAYFLATPAFAEPCTGTDRSGTPTPYGCDPNEIPSGLGTQNSHLGTPNSNLGTPDSKLGTDGVNINTGIKNPLGDNLNDIPAFIQAILRFVLLIGVPIVTLAIIYCGFLFVTAVGNSEKLKNAKRALLYTLIGAALLLGSLVISEAIKGTVDQIKAEHTIFYV